MGDLRLGRALDWLLDRLHALFGHDRELDRLSAALDALKAEAYSDGQLSTAEVEGIAARTRELEAALARYAAERGYPLGDARPASPGSFAVYREQQELAHAWLAGKNLRGGALGDLVTALTAGEAAATARLTTQIALDLVTSSSPAVAQEKVGLLRANLALVDDRQAQRAALAAVEAALGAALAAREPGETAPLTGVDFERAARFHTVVAVAPTPLPHEVAGTNRCFPNRPLPGWEATTRAATAATLDRLAARGLLFLDRIPRGQAGPAQVAVKLDLNFGAEGPPTVTDPATAGATIAELLARAAAAGRALHLTVGDSCGAENTPLGRTTLEVLRDTGNYHHALKAGVAFAAGRGEPGAAEALARLVAAEGRGVFLGAKEDSASSPADLAAVEAAAARHVTVVDFDRAGYTEVEPALGPLGLAAWGARAFRVATPWLAADFRVHVARALSTHVMAGWSGSVKGLIGLHAFGLRPADQGADARGDNLVAALPLMAQASGFLALWQARRGLPDLAARVAALGEPDLHERLEAARARWAALGERTAAWAAFARDTHALAEALALDRAAGESQVELMDRMRRETRAALDRADAHSPGFRQALWDAAAEATRCAEVAGHRLRHLVPEELRDEQVGMRIGLLAQLPYRSDLVVKSQPQLGEGGGPDAYATVTDVGVIIAGTNEAATDVAAWQAAGRRENLWAVNAPLWGCLAFGRGPMHADEVEVLG